MAAQKLSPKTRSNTTGVPSKRSFSGILPNLPIQFSESLLANAKPRSLAEREVLFEAGDTVTWEARHFWIRQRLTSRILECDRPRTFVDQQVRVAVSDRTAHTLDLPLAG